MSVDEQLLKETMAEAQVDLTATLVGKFSASDYVEILKIAEVRLRNRLVGFNSINLEIAKMEWREVVRDFYENRFWGFVPQSSKSKKPEKSLETNHHRLGIRFIWITFFSMCVTKVIILVLGQRYVKSNESSDFWFLMLAIALIVANFGYFLWKSRNYKD